MQINTKHALETLAKANALFLQLFKHGTLSVEMYKPDKTDLQQPHEKDEIYIVVSGSGEFYNDGITAPFLPGDFLFVPAGKEHRFLNFTADFATWVIFYGPKGGEKE